MTNSMTGIPYAGLQKSSPHLSTSELPPLRLAAHFFRLRPQRGALLLPATFQQGESLDLQALPFLLGKGLDFAWKFFSETCLLILFGTKIGGKNGKEGSLGDVLKHLFRKTPLLCGSLGGNFGCFNGGTSPTARQKRDFRPLGPGQRMM